MNVEHGINGNVSHIPSITEQSQNIQQRITRQLENLPQTPPLTDPIGGESSTCITAGLPDSSFQPRNTSSLLYRTSDQVVLEIQKEGENFVNTYEPNAPQLPNQVTEPNSLLSNHPTPERNAPIFSSPTEPDSVTARPFISKQMPTWLKDFLQHPSGKDTEYGSEIPEGPMEHVVLQSGHDITEQDTILMPSINKSSSIREQITPDTLLPDEHEQFSAMRELEKLVEKAQEKEGNSSVQLQRDEHVLTDTREVVPETEEQKRIRNWQKRWHRDIPLRSPDESI